MSQPNHRSAPRNPQVGVCILRVQREEEYVRITVTTNRHLGPTLVSAEPEQVTTYTNRADALAAAREFLDSFP
jgi:hypothetical protein